MDEVSPCAAVASACICLRTKTLYELSLILKRTGGAGKRLREQKRALFSGYQTPYDDAMIRRAVKDAVLKHEGD